MRQGDGRPITRGVAILATVLYGVHVSLAAPLGSHMEAEGNPAVLHFELMGPEWEDAPAGYMGIVPEAVFATLDVPRAFLDHYYYRWFKVKPRATFLDIAAFYPSMQPAAGSDAIPRGQYRISASIQLGKEANLAASIRRHYLSCMPEIPVLIGYCSPKRGNEPQPGCTVTVPVNARLVMRMTVYPFDAMNEFKDIAAAFKDLILSFVVSMK